MKRIALLALLGLGGCIFVDDDGPSDQALCGDGLVNGGGEACDDGNAIDGDGCSATCTIEVLAKCGDGVVNQASEQCDDGNIANGDGCSAACTTEPPRNAFISATWSFRDEATNTTTGCPTGFNTAALYSQPLGAQGQPVGSPYIDLFACSTMSGTTVAVPGGRYQVWIEITDQNNTNVYAKSLSTEVDVTNSDKSFNAQILNDGGYFKLAWILRGAASNNTLTCAQAGASGGLETVSTDIANSNNSASDIFNCDDTSGVTAGFVAGTYTVSVGALNTANQSIGTAPELTNKVIQDRNRVTDLGTVTVPITGM